MRGPSGKNSEHRYEGIGACQSITISPAFLVDDPRDRIVRMFIPKHQVETEIKRFHEAVRLTQRQVRKTMTRFREAFSSDRAYILEAHLMMLRDRNLGRQIKDCIRDNRVNAE